MKLTGIHYTRPDQIERLLDSGFDASGRGLQAWATGVYIATDRASAELYDDGERVPLLVQAEVNQPFVLEIDSTASSIFEAVSDAVTDAFGPEVAERVDPARLRSEKLSLAAELTDALKQAGFDALEVRQSWPAERGDARSIHFGGNQLIVFDFAAVEVLGLDVGAPLPAPALADVGTSSEIDAAAGIGSVGRDLDL